MKQRSEKLKALYNHIGYEGTFESFVDEVTVYDGTLRGQEFLFDGSIYKIYSRSEVTEAAKEEAIEYLKDNSIFKLSDDNKKYIKDNFIGIDFFDEVRYDTFKETGETDDFDGDSLDWFVSMFGKTDAQELLENAGLMNLEEVADYLISDKRNRSDNVTFLDRNEYKEVIEDELIYIYKILE